jgi:hypothetical protein
VAGVGFGGDGNFVLVFFCDVLFFALHWFMLVRHVLVHCNASFSQSSSSFPFFPFSLLCEGEGGGPREEEEEMNIPCM